VKGGCLWGCNLLKRGGDLGQMLIKERLAKPYDGGKKGKWGKDEDDRSK